MKQFIISDLFMKASNHNVKIVDMAFDMMDGIKMLRYLRSRHLGYQRYSDTLDTRGIVPLWITRPSEVTLK